jgi:hypothetical protein
VIGISVWKCTAQRHHLTEIPIIGDGIVFATLKIMERRGRKLKFVVEISHVSATSVRMVATQRRRRRSNLNWEANVSSSVGYWVPYRSKWPSQTIPCPSRVMYRGFRQAVSLFRMQLGAIRSAALSVFSHAALCARNWQDRPARGFTPRLWLSGSASHAVLPGNDHVTRRVWVCCAACCTLR